MCLLCGNDAFVVHLGSFGNFFFCESFVEFLVLLQLEEMSEVVESCGGNVAVVSPRACFVSCVFFLLCRS